jgi:KDO2-lipid IV(A) lauroyltransferase
VRNRSRNKLRNWLEAAPAWILLKFLYLLPRGTAKGAGVIVASIIYYVHRKLRRVANRNLQMAMPELNPEQRTAITKAVFSNLGMLLGEFSQFPKITASNISEYVVYDGYENYGAAAQQGKGVLLLTAHTGAWELCAFAHGCYGHKLSFLVRSLDNPLLDKFVNRYRELSGNKIIDKNKAVKPVLAALKRNEGVGLLVDVNVLGDQGVFCDFFGIPACSTPGLAIFALRSGAPVVPGFLIWDRELGKHRLRFEPEIELIRTGDTKQEVLLNTARFNRAIEEQVRRYPDQWLWIHKRWHTRPSGEPDLYGSLLSAQRNQQSSVKVEAEV